VLHDYCLEHPAFLDCSMCLMRRPAEQLRERSQTRLDPPRAGHGGLPGRLSRILALEPSKVSYSRGSRLHRNHLYTQTLGPCTWRESV